MANNRIALSKSIIDTLEIYDGSTQPLRIIHESGKVIDRAGTVHPSFILTLDNNWGSPVDYIAKWPRKRWTVCKIVYEYMLIRKIFGDNILDLLNAMIMNHGCPIATVRDFYASPKYYKGSIMESMKELYLSGDTYFYMKSIITPTAEEREVMRYTIQKGRRLIPPHIERNYKMLQPILSDMRRLVLDMRFNFDEWPMLSHLNQTQREAFLGMLYRPMTVMTGGAGTGKTTTIVAFLSYAAQMVEFRANHPTIAVVAFTGKAVSRAKELISTTPALDGFPLAVDTIHSTVMRGLGTKAYKLIICDEASMLDEFMVCTLINMAERIVFVGDPNQLQALGCGDMFNLLVKHVPTVTLNVNYRAKNDGLLHNLTAIYNRQYAEIITNESFGIVNGDLDTAVDLYIQDHENSIVICATNAHVNYINGVMFEKYGLYNGCPLMLTTNTPTYSNGQIMYYVTHHSTKDLILIDDIGQNHTVPATHCTLAHAITVDKSQGSQFSRVIFFYYSSRFIHRNRIYTALSRAQDVAILVTLDDTKMILAGLQREPDPRRHLFTNVVSLKETREILPWNDRAAELESIAYVPRQYKRIVL